MVLTMSVLMLSAMAGQVWAETESDKASAYPAKTIRIVSAGAAGSGNDLLARILADKMLEHWKQPVIVDNRPGAGGELSAGIGARAKPDGYTLTLGFNGNMAAAPAMRASLAYDPEKDFIAITEVATLPALLVINPSLHINTVQELIAYAKANPDTLKYGSGGIGTIAHLSGELFKSMTGSSMTAVPYKDGTQMVSDVLSGQLQLTFHTASVVLPFVQAKRLVALGTTSSTRIPAFPDIPTLAEAGVPGFQSVLWFGMFVPKGTPQPIVDKLHDELVRITQLKDVQDRLAPLGFVAVGNSSEEFKNFLKAEIARYEQVIAAAGIKKE